MLLTHTKLVFLESMHIVDVVALAIVDPPDWKGMHHVGRRQMVVTGELQQQRECNTLEELRMGSEWKTSEVRCYWRWAHRSRQGRVSTIDVKFRRKMQFLMGRREVAA